MGRSGGQLKTHGEVQVTSGIEMRRVLEAILFLADEPQTAATLAQVVELPRRTPSATPERAAA